MNITSLLAGKTDTEKSDIKATEIAKIDLTGTFQDAKGEISAQIVSVNKVPSGIEVFARAWKNGKVVGFGSDGTVEIERFRIINPPILVDDPLGIITRIGSTRTLREDPIQAIRETLLHTIKIVAKDGSQVVIGRVGNTTSNYFPNAGAVTAPTNAVLRSTVTGNFSTIRTDTTTRSAITSPNDTSAALLESFPSAGNFDELRRGGFGFPTTDIGTDTITSVTFSLWINSVTTMLGDTNVDIVGFTPSGDPPMVAGDYSNFSTTRYATGLAISTMSIGAYNDWTFNATGISNTHKTTNSYFGTTLKWDTDNNYTGSNPGDGSQTKITNKWADNVGTSSDPKLVVVHSVPVNTSNFFLMFQ